MGTSKEERIANENRYWQEQQNQLDRDWQESQANIDRAWQEQFWQSQFQQQSEFEREQADAQRNFEREFWKEQAEYNKPVNQAGRLLEAGFNPAVVMNGSGSSQLGTMTPSPSAPSVPGAPSPSGGSSHSFGSHSVTPPNTYSTDAQMFQSLSMLSDSLSKAAGVSNDIDRTQRLISSEISLNVARAQNERAGADYQDVMTGLQRMLGRERLGSEINRNIADAYKAYASGNYDKANVLYLDAQKRLVNLQGDKYQIEMPFVATAMQSLIALNNARRQEALSSASEHEAGADLKREQKQLVGEQIVTQQSLSDLAAANAAIRKWDAAAVNALYEDKDAFNARLSAMYGQLKKDQIINDAQYEEAMTRLKDAQRINSLPEWVRWISKTFDWTSKFVPFAAGAAGGYSVGSSSSDGVPPVSIANPYTMPNY